MNLLDEDMNGLYRQLKSNEKAIHSSNISQKGFTIIKGYINPDQTYKIKNKIKNIRLELFNDNECKIENMLSETQSKDNCNLEQINNINAFDDLFLKMSIKGGHLDILCNSLNDKYHGKISQKLPNFNLSQISARRTLSPIKWHNDVRYQTQSSETFSIQVFMCLDDMTHDSGTLKILPKSHLSGSYPSIDNLLDLNEINLILEAGDTVLFDSRLHHATSDVTDYKYSPWTIIMQYRSWWVKPLFDNWKFFRELPIISELTALERSILGQTSEVPIQAFSNSEVRKGLIENK